MPRINESSFDTYIMHRLLLHMFKSNEVIRTKLIELSKSRIGEECNCTTGCYNCLCSKFDGCTDDCKCFNYRNPVKSHPAHKLAISFDDINTHTIEKLKKHELQIMLNAKNRSIRGTKGELIARLLSAISGNKGFDSSPSASWINDKSISSPKL